MLSEFNRERDLKTVVPSDIRTARVYIRDSPCSDDAKEDETVSTIRRGKIRRSRSKNSSDDEGSLRRRHRMKDTHPDPLHVYIKTQYMTGSQELNGSCSSRSQHLAQRRQNNLPLSLSLKQNISNQADLQNVPQQHYRRPLTPHKTEKQLIEGPNKPIIVVDRSKVEDELMKQLNAKDIELAEMQNQTEKLKLERDNLKRLGLGYEKEKMKIVNQKNRLQSRNTVIQKELEIKTAKLLELENSLLANEQDLAQAKTSLEKLKTIIKQNRMTELQAQNKRLDLDITELKRNNLSLKQDNQTLSGQKTKLQQMIETLNMKIAKLQTITVTKEKGYQFQSMREQYLNRQIASLRTQLQAGRSQRQIHLEQLVETLQRQVYEKESELTSAKIKLDCMGRKQNQLKEQLKKQTSVQCIQIKDRFRKFLLEHQKFRKQHNQLKIEFAKLSRNLTRRSSILDNSDERDSQFGSYQDFSFELTPEKDI